MIRSLLRNEKSSLPVRISIYFWAEDGTTQAGTALKGKVVCHVISKEIIQGESIRLAIRGNEVASCHDPEGRKKNSKRSFCHMDAQLNDFSDRRLAPNGYYTFPFSIKLPSALPATCCFKNASKDMALRIQYTIVASGFGTKTEREFTVTSKCLPDERVPCIQHPVSQTIKSLNYVEQGILTLAASVKDTHVGRGDPIRLSISCRNDSMVDILKVQVKVVEYVMGDIKPSRTGDFPENRRFREDLFKTTAKVDGLLQKAVNEKKVKQAMRRSQAEQEQQYSWIYEELLNDAYPFEFRCPETARDTYKDNPSIKIPLKIGNPPVDGSSNDIPVLPYPTRTSSSQDPSRRAQSSSHIQSPQSETETQPITPLTSLEPLAPPIPAPRVEHSQQQREVRDPPGTYRSRHLSDPNPRRAQTYTNPATLQNQRMMPHTMAASTSAIPSAPSELEILASNAPVVSATLISMEEAVNAPATPIEPGIIILGGDAIVLQDDDDGSNCDNHNTIPIQPIIPVVPPMPSAPSIDILFEEMLVSVEDYDIICHKLCDSDWRGFFENNVNPNDFGNIIAHVNVDFDQPRVAAMLAPVVNGRNNFTCAYCAAAVRCTSEWNRNTMVERLAPYCIDLSQNNDLIRAQLDGWDRIIAERYLGHTGSITSRT